MREGTKGMKRMKRKIGGLMLLLSAAALVLSSCMRVQVNAEIKESGAAALGVTVGYSTEYFTEDDIDSDDHEVKRFTIDGKEYVGYTYMEDLKSAGELETALTGISESGSSMFKTCDVDIKSKLLFNEYSFDAVSDIMVDKDDAQNGMKASDLLAVDFTLVMPGKITSYDEGQLMADGRTILFKLDPTKENEIHVTSRSIAFTNIAIALVILTAGVIAAIVLLSKKKAEPADEPLPENWQSQVKVYDDADKFFGDDHKKGGEQ